MRVSFSFELHAMRNIALYIFLLVALFFFFQDRPLEWESLGTQILQTVEQVQLLNDLHSPFPLFIFLTSANTIFLTHRFYLFPLPFD